MNYEDNEIFQLIMKSGLFTGSSVLLLNELVRDIEKVNKKKLNKIKYLKTGKSRSNGRK